MKKLLQTRALSMCAALALLAALGACAEQKSLKDESPPASPQTSAARQESPVIAQMPLDALPQATATPVAKREPPGAEDVRAALGRIYGSAVSFDERGSQIAEGDFNGDGSEDLAVAVRTSAGKVGELNDELANWIVTDPRTVSPPDPRQFDPHQGVQRLQPAARPKVEPNDALLVVIHGFKASGWRNPDALQTYLLKNAAGSGLKSKARVEAQAAQKSVRLFGDVIQESLGGESGFLYWTGAGYGWLH